jgi:hypothetical protein
MIFYAALAGLIFCVTALFFDVRKNMEEKEAEGYIRPNGWLLVPLIMAGGAVLTVMVANGW